MPMPNWWRYLNKYTFNRLAVRKGNADLLTHIGRSSGKTYRTPLEAIPMENGYAVFMVYGPNTDWVRNTVESGSATLRKDGRDIRLTNPSVVDLNDVRGEIPTDVARPPGFLKVSQLLRMDLAE